MASLCFNYSGHGGTVVAMTRIQECQMLSALSLGIAALVSVGVEQAIYLTGFFIVLAMEDGEQ
jgi:hypothetical protein